MGIYNGAKNSELINNIRKLYTEVVYTTYEVSSLSSSSSSSFSQSQSTNPSSISADQLSSSASSSSSIQKHQRYYISFSHVKGHIDNKWNECADRLAAKGIAGLRCNEGRYRPIDTLTPADERDSTLVLVDDSIRQANAVAVAGAIMTS